MPAKTESLFVMVETEARGYKEGVRMGNVDTMKKKWFRIQWIQGV